MRIDYLKDKNEILKIENQFLKKKIEFLEQIVTSRTIGATKELLLQVIQDKGQCMTMSQICDMVECNMSTLRIYLYRSEFNKFRAGHYWYVNKTFRNMLREKIGEKNER